MHIELSPDSGELRDYVTVPAGTYVCTVAEANVGTTRSGDPRWGLRLVVAEGEFVGRQAAWDGIVFSERGKPRVRLILRAFGLPHTGRVDIEPQDLVGRRALVQVGPKEWHDERTGTTIRRNEVPFDGYAPLPGDDGEEAPAVDGDLPF